MKNAELQEIIKKLGGTKPIVTDGHTGTNSENVSDAMAALEQAIVKLKFIDSKPHTSADVTWPEVLEAVHKVVFLYHHYGWPVDDRLYTLLIWTLQPRERKRRSRQKEQSRMGIGACVELAWRKRYGTQVSAAELGRRVGVSRTTVSRWRKDSEYRRLLEAPVLNEDFVEILDRDLSGGKS